MKSAAEERDKIAAMVKEGKSLPDIEAAVDPAPAAVPAGGGCPAHAPTKL